MHRPNISTSLSVLCLWLLAAPSLAHDPQHHESSQREAIVETTFGRSAPAQAANRKIDIIMNDQLRFEPAHITVRQGEIITLVVHNQGAMLHELVLGTAEGLAEHAALMRRFPNMEHDEPFMAHVAPGQSASIVWQFDHAGTVHFGCLLPGHFEGGMAGTIHVEQTTRKDTP